eukprot:TRINITY_DN1036_c0_g1_i1.p1 TRINITY_DN1036_c0_g1~~TRINITY_DN1036_c0_g1_i1.p1  ORF type:complete len:122 (-),score=42.30 TRINITY_DN1036_c0_g1_i1:48-413(-)
MQYIIFNIDVNHTIPRCAKCAAYIQVDDIETICGKEYVHFVETLKYKERFESLITWRKEVGMNNSDVTKILKLKHDDLNCNRSDLHGIIIDLLCLTSVRIEDIAYLQIIRAKGGKWGNTVV